METSLPPKLFDLNELRKHALHSADAGAVTADYPLDIKQACALLNNALATEIVCVLRYRHHEVTAKGIDFPQVVAEFKEHAESEARHAAMIAERIDQLGGDPNLEPVSLASRSATEYGDAKDLLAMIRDDLIAERIVIEVYRRMIQWFGEGDPTTRRMLESILEDEEDHANDLADLLAQMR